MKSFVALVLLLGIVSSASIATEPSEQPEKANVTFSHDFAFLHAAEICNWSVVPLEVVLALQRNFCNSQEAKPEYANITKCFIAGGAPLNALFEQDAQNFRCRDRDILYRNYIKIASRSCPNPAQTIRIAAQGVIIELSLRSRFSPSEEEAACYQELAKRLYRSFHAPDQPPAQSSTPSFPEPVPTAEPYPVPIPYGSGH
ncbi:unnamed protein product, partial [Mesorhabditis spiculigera]